MRQIDVSVLELQTITARLFKKLVTMANDLNQLRGEVDSSIDKDKLSDLLVNDFASVKQLFEKSGNIRVTSSAATGQLSCS